MILVLVGVGLSMGLVGMTLAAVAFAAGRRRTGGWKHLWWVTLLVLLSSGTTYSIGVAALLGPLPLPIDWALAAFVFGVSTAICGFGTCAITTAIGLLTRPTAQIPEYPPISR